MKNFAMLTLLVASLAAGRLSAVAAETPSKADIDALFAQRRYEEAAAAYRLYLQKNPEDVPATYALASLLSQLRQHPEAAQVLEALLKQHPDHLAASFKLGVEYTSLQRTQEAEKIFRALSQSSNKDMAAAAADALRRLGQDQTRAANFQAEQKIHELAAKGQQRQVLDAIAGLEKTGPLSWTMEMQRLYAWQSLGELEKALQRSQELAGMRPNDADLGLVRGELLLQAGRRPEALALWQQVKNEAPGTPVAQQASQKIAEQIREQAEERVYELARRNQHQEVIAAVSELEKERVELPLILDLQRLYAYQALEAYAAGLARADKLIARHPQSPELALLRGDFLAGTGKTNEAQQAWRQVIQQHPNTPPAAEAAKRLQGGAPTPAPAPPPAPPPTDEKAEARIYELAEKDQHREVVPAIDELEKRQPLSWHLQMQRLYALSSLGQYQLALELADKLALQNPRATDLALVRADLLAQQGHKQQAVALWREIQKENAGTPAAFEAERRLEAEAVEAEQQRIFQLARRGQHREVVAAVGGLELKGPLPLFMEMQRLYSLQALGRYREATERALRLSAAHTNSTELALMRADLLIAQREWKPAAQALKDLKRDHAGTPAAIEAAKRMEILPPVANVDKWNWGEAYASGDYYGRWASIIGSGFVRSGTYIPGARWLQPYTQFQFGVDTKSDVSGQPTVIEDNHVGFYAGVRAQVFTTEYLFLYAMAGTDKDLLDRREDGDWAFDFQAGIYGFKAWGPGMVLENVSPAEFAVGVDAATSLETNRSLRPHAIFWRGDWFVDAGADFSYYDRYSNWIGYGQAREGFRLLQFGPRAALDAYAVENLAWDVRGNFYDNFVSLGPGARVIWVPHRNWEVVLRAEWLNGFYFGRDDRNNRGSTPGQYDEAHVGLSVGMRW
jgi:tetratricopeptide (TPR) repeat protein